MKPVTITHGRATAQATGVLEQCPLTDTSSLFKEKLLLVTKRARQEERRGASQVGELSGATKGKGYGCSGNHKPACWAGAQGLCVWDSSSCSIAENTSKGI